MRTLNAHRTPYAVDHVNAPDLLRRDDDSAEVCRELAASMSLVHSAGISRPIARAAIGTSECVVKPGMVLISRNHGSRPSNMMSARETSRHPNRSNAVIAMCVH